MNGYPEWRRYSSLSHVMTTIASITRIIEEEILEANDEQ